MRSAPAQAAFTGLLAAEVGGSAVVATRCEFGCILPALGIRIYPLA